MFRPKDSTILPGLNYEQKPCKNFLLQNIKRLREMQKETQKKLAVQNGFPPMVGRRRVSNLKTDNYHKTHRSEADLVRDPTVSSLHSRLSTPITAMASAKPVRNQKMQTVPLEKLQKGSKAISTKMPKSDSQPTRPLKIVSPSRKKSEKKIVEKAAIPISSAASSYAPSNSDSGSSVDDHEKNNMPEKVNEEALNQLINGENKDFVAYNTFRTYKEKTKPRKLEVADPLPSNYRFGEVPRYLHESKKENKVPDGTGDSLHPKDHPGYIQLTGKERKDHLEEFQKMYSELINKLRNIPISSDSYSNRQRKMQLEKELEKLEELMKMFSRDGLYMRVS